MQKLKLSLEVAPTTLATFLADCSKSSAGCYLFTILNSVLWPRTLSNDLDLWTLPRLFKMNQRVTYLGQTSFCSKSCCPDTHTHTHTHAHTPGRLIYLTTEMIG